MDIYDAIRSAPIPVLIVVLIALVVLTAYIMYEYAKLKGLDGIRAQVYQYMLKAEHIYYASGQGRQKLKYVVSRARGLLPKWLQVFISDEALINLIEVWFREVKDLLDDGRVNESINAGANVSGQPPDEAISGIVE